MNSAKRVTGDRKATLVHDFVVGHEYEVIVRAVGPDGTLQAMELSARNSITIVGKVAVPSTPGVLTAVGFLESITLTWTNPLDYDFSTMEIWRSVTNNVVTAVKIAEVKGITYIDALGAADITRYYWIRAVNTSGKTSDYYPRTATGVGATSVGVAVTSIDDFAVTATKMFTKAIILTADSWTNNSPGAGSVAWNAHSIVYNGASYPITAGNTALAYVYWTIGGATYSTSATHPALGTTAFMVAVNTAGIHTLVWNSSANMVIGTAFIANLAVTNAKVSNLDAGKITTGTLVVGRTEAKCTDALADQTSANTAADTAKVQGSTIIIGGYIGTAFLTATNVQAGTLTGRTVQTQAANQRIVMSGTSHNLAFYNAGGTKMVEINTLTNAFVIVGDQASKEHALINNGSIGLRTETGGKILLAGHFWTGAAWDTNTFYIDTEGDAAFCAAIGNFPILLSSGDVKLSTTKGLYVNNIEVVTDQQAAIANAVDAATTMARLNDLLAACRTHGLIDT